MPQPMPCLVKPRVRLEDSTTSYLLVDLVNSMLKNGQFGLIRLVAPRGYGKSKALEYLAVQIADPRLILHDQGAITRFPLCPTGSPGSLILVATTPDSLSRFPSLHLLPWCKDDCIEYCLNSNKSRTASAMSRLGDDGESVLHGSPFHCRLVLDEFLEDESVANTAVALKRIFEREQLDDSSLSRVFTICLQQLTRSPNQTKPSQIEIEGLSKQILRLCDNEFFCHIVVVEMLVKWLRAESLQGTDSVPDQSDSEDFPQRDDDTNAELASARSRRRRMTDWGRAVLDAVRTAWKRSLHAFLTSASRNYSALQQAADAVLQRPQYGATGKFDLSQIPDVISKELADRIMREEIPCFDALRKLLSRSLRNGSSFAATVLCICGETRSVAQALNLRRPKGTAPIDLSNARICKLELRHQRVRRAKFRKANLEGTDLDLVTISKCSATNANLQSSRMRDCTLLRSNFASANFAACKLENLKTRDCDFSAAKLANSSGYQSYFRRTIFTDGDLRESLWSDCTFIDCTFFQLHCEGALFQRCKFLSCDLHEFEFQDTTFQDCQFLHSDLQNCTMEGMALDGADFAHSYFYRADLTGTKIHQGNFENTNFMRARLADIDWEGANLRNADLRHVDFHMGTTRSGIVDSDIASEGTRTGFYTDDYLDMTFRAPEEIRKANLVGADLRGADLSFTDFYLVDLRDARLDSNQVQYLRGCRAIL